jgi:hypothetical protein
MSRDRLEDFGIIAERIKHILDNELWIEVNSPDENLWFDKYHSENKHAKFNALDRLLTELNWVYNKMQSLYALARFAEDKDVDINLSL